MARDVLFYTLAVCVAVATFFLVWFALTFIRIGRSIAGVIEEVRTRIERIGASIENLTERITHSTASLAAVAAGVKQLLTWFGERRTKRSPRRSASDSE